MLEPEGELGGRRHGEWRNERDVSRGIYHSIIEMGLYKVLVRYRYKVETGETQNMHIWDKKRVSCTG